MALQVTLTTLLQTSSLSDQRGAAIVLNEHKNSLLQMSKVFRCDR